MSDHRPGPERPDAVAAPRDELLDRLFARFAEGEIDAALELTTEDVVVDRRNSEAPWGRAVIRGRAEARADFDAFHRLWEEFGGFRWDRLRAQEAGAGRLAVESRIRGRGPATGLAMEARGGWLISFRGDRISAAVLHQSFDEALLAGRRRALAEARLYLVCEARPGGSDPAALLEAALSGGVEIVQLRDKRAGDEQLVAAARGFRAAADRHGALFFVNDRPDLVAPCAADGVHVGQADVAVDEARRIAGPAALVGLSSHSPQQFDAALAAAGAARPDQLSAGPVRETPTKRGRPAAGLELIRHAAAAAAGASVPWFAIGGIDADTVEEVVAAGARRIVVVRAIRDAPDPAQAARALRAALERAGPLPAQAGESA